MLHATGDIWKWLDDGCHLVIPTNIGWRMDGSNVMGAGLAKQAATRYPKLDKWYGMICSACQHITPVCLADVPDAPLIMFPVKPLNREAPNLSWKSGANVDLIYKSTKQLASFRLIRRIALPMVGCGNGGLDPELVRPILAANLDDRFTLVELPPKP